MSSMHGFDSVVVYYKPKKKTKKRNKLYLRLNYVDYHRCQTESQAHYEKIRANVNATSPKELQRSHVLVFPVVVIAIQTNIDLLHKTGRLCWWWFFDFYLSPN